MHGHRQGVSCFASAGVHRLGAGMKQMTEYQKGRADERKVVRQKVEKMLGMVKRLEIHQSAQVTLQELGIWMDERTNGVTKRFALAAAEALQVEAIRRNLMRM